MKASARRTPGALLQVRSTALRGSLPVLLLTILLAGCVTAPPQATASATFVVVRHAEKTDDGNRDPPLAMAGIARARRLAAALHDDAVVAVYATPYQRTQQTAAAIAGDHRLAVTTYPASEPATALALRLRRHQENGTVLVVGHSNTAPGIAAALCDCAATPLGDNDYGRVYRIRVDADGAAVLQESILP